MEAILNRIKKIKKNCNSFVKLFCRKDIEEVTYYKQKRYSFATIKSVHNNEEKDDIINPKEHLNLIIEIEHPYQQKFMMKGVYIFEAMEFYKILKYQMRNLV
jgi:hypothetical protein